MFLSGFTHLQFSSVQSLSRVQLLGPPARLLCLWDSPGKNTRVGSHSLLQGIFLTQGSNTGLLYCRQILYQLSYKLLLLLSRFSRVRLCATPWTAAYQAPPSMGFSRQEYWSGLPLPSPVIMYGYETWTIMKAAAAAKLLQSCLTLCNPMDSSPSGSSVHGIL